MKLSKYNYYTRNDNQELLLFNTLNGTKSFLKVSRENASAAEAFLSGKGEESGLSSSLYDELVKWGYVIPEELDEDVLLRKIYVDSISDPRLQITILPTEQCNFRCKYCYESFPDKVMSEETQSALLLFLKKNLGKYSALHISWFGGEPLLALDIIEHLSEKIKEICAFYRKPYTASMTTNGFLLDADTFKRLLKCNVVYYQITVDGTKDIHDVQRPHAHLAVSTYDRVIGNLKQIKSQVKNGMFRITIRSNFSKLHFGKIAEYKKTFADLLGDDKRFQFFVRPVMDWGGESVCEFKDNLVDGSGLDAFYDALMSCESKLNFIYGDFLDCASAVCEAGKKNAFVIIPDGGVYKCTCHFEEPEARIGSLRSDGNLELDPYAAAGWLCDPSHCKAGCSYAPICLRESCPAVRVLKQEKKSNCPLEKRSLDKILQLLDRENEAFRRVD